MNANPDRCRRQNKWRGAGPNRRSSARLGWLASLAVLVAVSSTAVSAQAATGGASSSFEGAGAAGENLAFSSMRSAGATWYGPGFYGNRTACGQVLRPDTIGVAHRSLPCGTTVKFVYHGQFLITKVIDRGPYTRGNSWDLTNGARMALGFNGSGQLHYAVALGSPRR
jgi:rare lipoprotein A (peptidoglycan hydrolase)